MPQIRTHWKQVLQLENQSIIINNRYNNEKSVRTTNVKLTKTKFIRISYAEKPPKRDFIKENVKNLKQISQSKSTERSDHDLNLKPSLNKSRATVKSRSAINLSNASVNTSTKKTDSSMSSAFSRTNRSHN